VKILLFILCNAAPSIAATQSTDIAAEQQRNAQRFIDNAAFRSDWYLPSVQISMQEFQYTLEKFRTVRPWGNDMLPVIHLICEHIKTLKPNKKRTQYLMAELMYRTRPRLAEDIVPMACVCYRQRTYDCSFYIRGLACSSYFRGTSDIVQKHQNIVHNILSFYDQLPFTYQVEEVEADLTDLFPEINSIPNGIRVAVESLFGIVLPQKLDPTPRIPVHALLRANDTVTLHSLLGECSLPTPPRIKMRDSTPAQYAQCLIKQSLAKRSYQPLFSLALTPETFQSVLRSFHRARPWTKQAKSVIHEICQYIQSNPHTPGQDPSEHTYDSQRLMASLLCATRPYPQRMVVAGDSRSITYRFTFEKGSGYIPLTSEDNKIIHPALLSILWIITQGHIHHDHMLKECIADTSTFCFLTIPIITSCMYKSIKLYGPNQELELDMLFNQHKPVTLQSLKELL